MEKPKYNVGQSLTLVRKFSNFVNVIVQGYFYEKRFYFFGKEKITYVLYSPTDNKWYFCTDKNLYNRKEFIDKYESGIHIQGLLNKY